MIDCRNSRNFEIGWALAEHMGADRIQDAPHDGDVLRTDRPVWKWATPAAKNAMWNSAAYWASTEFAIVRNNQAPYASAVQPACSTSRV